MSLPKPFYDLDGITIYNSDCREILPRLKADHIITDPPYSARTHDGHDASAGGHKGFGNDGARRQALAYEHLTQTDCERFAELFDEVCNGWIVWMTDHVLFPAIQGSIEALDRYVFAPLPFYAPGSRVRLSGDGPSSWTIWILVSRTAKQSKWGTLPGGYVAGPGWSDSQWIGGKPTFLMTSLVRDYSRAGELVVDPFMGAGTTLDACKRLGRRAIGIDIDHNACKAAVRRLAQRELIAV